MTMAALTEHALEVAVILMAAVGVLRLLRRRPAALRHWVLTVAVVCALAAPVVGLVAPAWRLGIAAAPHLAAPSFPPRVGDGGPSVVVTVVPDIPRAADSRGLPGRVSLASAAVSVWLAGAVLGLGMLGVGLVRLSRLASRAVPVTSGRWADIASAIARESGCVRRVTLLQSDHPALLVTCGALRPCILLSRGAAAWSDERIRIVLHHELAHIRRGDWAVHLAAEVLRAVYWFNPLAWIVCRRLRQESEQACDDAVLNRGVEGSHYAGHLLDVARELHGRRAWVPAPSMARASNLERRVRAMLDTDRNRRPVSRRARSVTAAALLLLSISVTGAALGQSFATLGGSVVDSSNAPVPGVTVTLTNPQTEARYEVKSDRTGRYEFVGLPPGEYGLRATLHGFTPVERRVAIAGQNVQLDLALELGSLQETITVRSAGSRDTSGPRAPAGRRGSVSRDRAAACAAQHTGAAVGGHIQPPLKVFDMPPYYAPALADAGVEGTVQLQARIGTDGNVESDVRVVSSPHAELSRAAIDAVRQWEFQPTLLNCVPVSTAIGVTVEFQRER